MAEQTLKDKTAKGLFWGGLSNGAQQLLNLLFGICLARMLNAEDYGMVGMLSIFSLIAAALQESGFTAALANKKEVSHSDYNAVFWFSTSVSLVLYTILFFCAPLIARFYETPELTDLARYSFLGFFIASLGVAHSAYLFRHLMVKQKAIATVSGLAISGVVSVTMAYLGFSYWGIATQSIVYISVVNFCYYRFSPWRPTWSFSLSPLRGMIGFSSKILLTNVFNQINNNLFSVFLGKFYSGAEVGYFTQANKWNAMGHSLISGMVNGVAQPVLASVDHENERQQRVFRKMLRFTAFVSFPALFGLSLIAPDFITIAIGSKWLPSAGMLQLLCLWGAFLPIGNLYSNLLISRGKSNIYMWSTISLGVCQLLAMCLDYSYGIRLMIIIYVLVNIAWLLVWHYFVWRAIRLRLIAALLDVLPFAVIAAGTMLLTAYLTDSLENVYLSMFAKISLGAALYVGVLWLSGSVTFRESLQYLWKKKE